MSIADDHRPCRASRATGSRPTIGVVAGWQVYERTTPELVSRGRLSRHRRGGSGPRLRRALLVRRGRADRRPHRGPPRVARSWRPSRLRPGRRLEHGRARLRLAAAQHSAPRARARASAVGLPRRLRRLRRRVPGRGGRQRSGLSRGARAPQGARASTGRVRRRRSPGPRRQLPPPRRLPNAARESSGSTSAKSSWHPASTARRVAIRRCARSSRPAAPSPPSSRATTRRRSGPCVPSPRPAAACPRRSR